MEHWSLYHDFRTWNGISSSCELMQLPRKDPCARQTVTGRPPMRTVLVDVADDTPLDVQIASGCTFLYIISMLSSMQLVHSALVSCERRSRIKSRPASLADCRSCRQRYDEPPVGSARPRPFIGGGYGVPAGSRGGVWRVKRC